MQAEVVIFESDNYIIACSSFFLSFYTFLHLQTLLVMSVHALLAAGELSQAVDLSEEQCHHHGHRLPQSTLDELKLACASSQPQLLDKVEVSYNNSKHTYNSVLNEHKCFSYIIGTDRGSLSASDIELADAL